VEEERTANAGRTTAIARPRSTCRNQPRGSFVEPCVGDTTASRNVPCLGKYRCRRARRRAKRDLLNAGGWGIFRWASRVSPSCTLLGSSTQVLALGGEPAVHDGGANLSEHLGRHVTESESKSSRRQELCPFLFVAARYRTHRGNAWAAPEQSCPQCASEGTDRPARASGAGPDTIWEREPAGNSSRSDGRIANSYSFHGRAGASITPGR
jgi:hypothetical protein